jgi:hypothetical protein
MDTEGNSETLADDVVDGQLDGLLGGDAEDDSGEPTIETPKAT